MAGTGIGERLGAGGLFMNKLDLAVVIVLALSFIFGYRRGFVLQLVSLLSLFVAWLAAYLFYDDIAPWVGQVIPVEAFVAQTGYEELLKDLRLDQYIIGAISFALLLFSVKIALSAAGRLLNVLAKIPGLNMVNRWSGGLLALLEGVVLIMVIIQIMAVIANEPVQAWLHGSRAAEWSMEWVPVLFGKMKELPATVS
ncbi:MAG: hypothetical protein K0R57_3142 [Paenibacillaceae bacterium]|jgi:uncharacterized membrane protein required for colicin V production|nr:hypothetical protein [Paenibacillaceae bacterium]